VPARKPDQPREYKVGDRVIDSLSNGRIEEATITAIIEHTSGKKLQVDFGKDVTALINTWRVVE